MNYKIKRLIFSVLTLSLVSQHHLVHADINTDTERLLNWAENVYPEIFPTHQLTHSIEPWLFRYYPETGVYAGVNLGDNNVYVLGGPWGDNITPIDSLANLLLSVDQSGGNDGIPACDTGQIPAGFSYSQNGNVVNVTTNGQCVVLPASTNNTLCSAPRQATQTGISVLAATTLTQYRMGGITTVLPINPFESMASGFSGKHCTINAPADMQNVIVNQDICLDVTQQFEASLGNLQNVPGISINPPITVTTQGTTSSTRVDNCFNTDADSIADAYSGEVWIKQNGAFVKMPTF